MACGRSNAQPIDPELLRVFEINQMGEITPNVSVTYGELGTPTFIRSSTAFLTRRSDADAMDILADFVNAHPALFGVPFPEETGYRVLRNYITPSLGVRHITLQQRHNGQDFFGHLLTANITTDGMLVNIGSSFLPGPAGVTGAPACGARDAIAAACDALNDERMEDLLALVTVTADCTTDWAAGQSFGTGSAVGVMFVQSVLYAVSASEVVQAWDVRLPYTEADGTQWQCIVDHATGEVLMSRNLVSHFCQPEVTFKVFPSDSPVPGTPGLTTPVTTGDSECVMRLQNEQTPCPGDPGDGRVLVTVGPNQYSPFGWINDGQFLRCVDLNSGTIAQACGNNAWARASTTDAPPLASDVQNRVFAPTLVWGNSDSEKVVAAVQAFYVVNEWHDRMWSLGFDELAGNFQQVNSQVGGVTQGIGGDALEIVITGAIGYGTNGSYTDGRIEDGREYTITYAVEGARPAAMDRTVLYHELTHAMSMRLHGNYYYVGIEAAGMGEGWADYFAIALTHQPADDPTAPYPVFSWPALRGSAPFNHYYFGARFFPYCTDMGKCPLTYGHIDSSTVETDFGNVPINPNRPPIFVPTEQHNAGQAWAMMLIECRAELAEEIGADDANEVLLQLVVDGMKLDPGAPKFVDARDAIMQADILRYGGSHLPALWRGFTQRGLGWNASSVTARVGNQVVHTVTDDFEPPDAAVSFFFPDDVPLTIRTCGWTEIDAMVVSPLGVISSVVADAEANGCVLGLPGEMPPVSPGIYRLALAPAPCRDSWVLWVGASTEGSSPAIAGESAHFSVTAGNSVIAFEDDMDSVPQSGWVTSPVTTPAPPGAWGHADPVGSTVTPGRDATPGEGLKCWVTQNKVYPLPSVLADDVDPGVSVVLETPEVTLPIETKAIIEFRQWYVDRNPSLTAQQPSSSDVECTVEVVQGTTTTPVATYRPQDAAARWQRRRMAVPTTLAQGSLIVRFTYTDVGTDTVLEGGIDDVVIYYIESCDDCCDGDFNRDGVADSMDVEYLIDVIAGGANPTCTDPDFNRDGTADQDDIAALINYNAGGGCP